MKKLARTLLILSILVAALAEASLVVNIINTDLWFQREIARRLGVEDALPKTARECVDAILSTSTDPYINSLTVEKIADNQGVWPCAGIEEVRRVIPDYAFPTLSGGMDVYYEELIEFGQALPVWEPCVEATRDNALRSTYPLQLSNVRTRFRIHNQFNDAAWLEQLYRPTIDVNPIDMKARGLETGDAVEVRNDRGSFKVYVHANEGTPRRRLKLSTLSSSSFWSAGDRFCL